MEIAFLAQSFTFYNPLSSAPPPISSMVGLAWADITTGEVQLAEVSLAALGDELVRISPAEILISQPLNAG